MSGAGGEAGLGVRERRVLDNGLIVLVMQRRHLPTVSATLLLPAGVAYEPEDRAGTAYFVSQLLTLGTEKRTAVGLAEEVDGLGASLSSSCDYDFATIEIAGLSRDLQKLVEVLADVARNPAFAEEEIERRRSQILGLLEKREDDYNDLVRNRFFELIYGEHPYHRTKEGKSGSVRLAAKVDLTGFYGRAYSAAGSILAMVGDVDIAEALRVAEQRFGGWTGAPDGATLPDVPPAAPGRRVATIQKDVTQAYIRIGSVGIARNDPDFHAAAITNYVLGGAGFGSRLMKNLREDRGLTYGVHTNFLTRKRPGYFFAATQTKVETMNETIREIFRECESMAERGVTDDELEWAKRFFTGSLPLQLETNDQLAQKILEQEFFGLEDQFWLQDLEKMREVTSAHVMDFARRRVRPESFTVVVLADFRKQGLEIAES